MPPQNEELQCCFCDATITPDPVNGWDQGHNPECPDYPDLGGTDARCCDTCNTQVVIPSRLNRILIDDQILSLFDDQARADRIRSTLSQLGECGEPSNSVSQESDDVRNAGQE